MCFLFLQTFFSLKGTSASIVLTQKNAETAQVGKSIDLSCEVSGYNINDLHMDWIRQASGGNLVWIAAFRTGHGTFIADYTSSYEGRFTITSDESINTAYLQINNLKVEDTATYYCARHTAIKNHHLPYKNIMTIPLSDHKAAGDTQDWPFLSHLYT
ncbi:unnamed protein product [Staurois parvus]|uniref:Ig-like domain-containing protein n=1 Tax=Staurois parvus TaxID=386267 RepID=A0ABN9DE77_9NEOB|nr:unnamed protein product [Staurois parvus]